ncbi:DUF4199 domain-containing protein [Phaeodactylibacter xiamenensis]|uniref:DUF4199 domain-containing protein n=1 Tax=Phaeodactylibacter xiamenensis TaxID=1524460 RepID=A0A098RXB1_9BACT|nr:DUF4199 domain-containing protein [Phaeodactylibacter xiamenensis]KGE84799.1 hypothetical protein IX84_31790 [Phaeodactylibacter xiamenensis]
MLLLFNFLGPEVIILFFVIMLLLIPRKNQVSGSVLQPFEFAGAPNFSQSNVGKFITGQQSSNVRYGASYVRLSIAYGLVYSILAFVISQYFFSDSYMYESEEFIFIPTLISLGIALIALLLCIRHYRSLNFGQLTLKKGLSIGAVFGLASGIISAALSYVYFYIINPYALDDLIDYQLSVSGFENDEYFRETFVESFSTGLLLAIPSNMLYGLILSFFLSLFLKTK